MDCWLRQCCCACGPSNLTPYALPAVRLPTSQIARQLEEFKGKVAGMNSRWQELKPKGGPSGNPAVVLAKITEYANAITEMREESAKLQKEVGKQHRLSRAVRPQP